MSDSTDSTDSTDVIETTEKPKKQMSEDRMKQLQAARVKALEKRRMLAELTKKEKQIKDDTLKERMEKIKEYEERSVIAKTEKVKPKKKTKPVVVESESESESESDSEESVEYVPVRKTRQTTSKQSKPKKDTNRDSRALAAEIARDELRKKIARENMDVAFKSIFPLYTLQFK